MIPNILRTAIPRLFSAALIVLRLLHAPRISWPTPRKRTLSQTELAKARAQSPFRRELTV